MKCARCGNEDRRLMGNDRGLWYCRRCVAFSRLDIGQSVKVPQLKTPEWNGTVKLDFELTPYQKEVSRQILENLKAGKSTFCFAVAGAGKTEITFESIDWFLRQGKKVCFAISRRQVVLEIAQRLSAAFSSAQVVAVCEGHTQVTDGDLIVCTTHQLYRYPECFDLLILDELDAFPYRGNALLETLALRSCRGVRLMLSATPDAKSRQEMESGQLASVRLFRRPHGHPVPEPQVHLLPVGLQVILTLFHIARLAPAQILLFVPRIRDGRWLSKLFGCPCIDSQTQDKDKIMEEFRNGQFRLLVSTTLLERGITVPSVQIIVLKADHPVFTTASLVQIFGRAGRSFHDPEGECLCFASTMSDSIKECVTLLQKMNESA